MEWPGSGIGTFLLSCAVIAAAAIPAGNLRDASAQTRPQKPPPQVRVTTRLVSLNVVVTDKHGEPVRGLTRDDFTVFDEGHPQKIEFFSEVTDAVPPLPAPLLPNTFTNELARRGATPESVVVILFDALNSSAMSQGFSLHRVRAMLRRLQPDDHVGLYVLGNQLEILHDFTQDATELIAAIQRYDTRKQVKKEARAKGPLDLFLDGKDNTYQYYREHGGPGRLEQIRSNQFGTREALEEIRRHLAGVKGRKSVVWVTDTLRDQGDLLTSPMHLISQDYILNLQFVARQFNDVGIAIYPVSAEGLQTPPARFEDGRWVEDWGPIYVQNGQHTEMVELAKRTGGRAWVNRNDVETGVKRAMEDARLSYTMAYYPDHMDPDVNFHKIQVKVRQPHVNVLARSGYFAAQHGRSGAISREDRVALFRQVAVSPLDATAVPMTVHLESASDGGARRLIANVKCDPAPLISFADSGRWNGRLDVMFMQLDAKENVLDARNFDLNLDLTPEQYQKIVNTGILLVAKLRSISEASTLAVILRDEASGTVGSVHVPLAHGEPASQ